MLITVLSAEGSAARCQTPAGELAIRWRGVDIPVAGAVVDVELDAVGELAWGTDISPVTDTATEADAGVLVGVLEQIEGDVATLRAGGSVVLLELSGDVPPAALGQRVRVRPVRWEAWPTGI